MTELTPSTSPLSGNDISSSIITSIDEGSRINISAFVRPTGGKKLQVTVLGLCRKGFRFVSKGDFETGTELLLNLPKFASLEAKILKEDGGIYLCAFEPELHVAVFEHLQGLFPEL